MIRRGGDAVAWWRGEGEVRRPEARRHATDYVRSFREPRGPRASIHPCRAATDRPLIPTDQAKDELLNDELE